MEKYCSDFDTFGSHSGLAKFYNEEENNSVTFLNLEYNTGYYINGFTIGDINEWYFYNGDDEILESIKWTNWAPAMPHPLIDQFTVITIGCFTDDRSRWCNYTNNSIFKAVCEWRC